MHHEELRNQMFQLRSKRTFLDSFWIEPSGLTALNAGNSAWTLVGLEVHVFWSRDFSRSRSWDSYFEILLSPGSPRSGPRCIPTFFPFLPFFFSFPSSPLHLCPAALRGWLPRGELQFSVIKISRLVTGILKCRNMTKTLLAWSLGDREGFKPTLQPILHHATF